ncbi:MAG: aminotransferase class V-fold PLP-dependent enzyme [Alphaproteobacteria bacterium]|nr:aminotransferase class V-fold PLP-dependent enzyme [Alphaproteobacteria bacterium]
MPGFKHHFSRSIGRSGAPLHFAAHSHHPWPDVTLQAQQRCWEDAATLLDSKWSTIFESVIPAAQKHIARQLSLPDPGTIVFAPNTHSLLLRLLSATRGLPKHNVLATDSEFHSFTRQMSRLAEDELVNLVRVPVEPFPTFKQRFLAAMAARDDWDIVWLSHVFFNSGFVLSPDDIGDIIAAIQDRETFAVLDGYHAFMALPVDLSAIAQRAFYVAGGYKYAMAGEGACFMHCPPGYGERPRDTGWYAEFGALGKSRDGVVAYGKDASRFAGATFDPSGLYRLNAVMGWLEREGITVAATHDYCLTLQRHFLDRLAAEKTSLRPINLMIADERRRGRFLTFRTSEASRLDSELAARNIIVDHRGDCLRIGFGIYQEEGDVGRLVAALKDIG